MNNKNIIKLDVSKNDVLDAIKKAKEHTFVDNLRNRHFNVQFDSKLRGYVGEIALKNWFNNYGIEMEATNYFDEDYGMDIDFEYKGIEIELKTSLIPDVDKTLNNVIKNRDLKIIRRTRKIDDLKGDIHIQIFYDQLTNKKDEWLEKQEIDLDSNDLEYLYENLLGKSYLNNTYLVAWFDKATLAEHMNKLKGYEKSWRFEKRRFWVCSLQECKSPKLLIDHLKEI